ncbi:hypothetical protein L218DRAFT_646900 [Marasmius fiardii PR-910]|nr:hypothetical protein L218DRAFT_646900 [Marasmius fiardii PR-910]
MSRGVSIVLIFIYLLYLCFQLGSHSHLYQDLQKKNRRLSRAIQSEAEKLKMRVLHRPSPSSQTVKDKFAEDSPTKPASRDLSTDHSLPHGIPLPTVAPEMPKPASDHFNFRHQPPPPPSAIFGKHNLSGATEDPYLHFKSQIDLERASSYPPHRESEISWLLIGVSLVFLTVAVGFTVDSLVESMDGISKTLNKTWIALILLPAVSSVAECSTAIGASFKDQLALSINVAVGSSIQTAFFVIPLMVNIAWMMGKPLSLLFDPFEALILYISVQTMSHVVGDGKSNWLEGAILISLFVIIAVCLWFYPGSSLLSSLSVCT